MTTEDAFLAEIIAKPDDDLPRLVFADWLEENGQTKRAEFIRVQILIDQIEYDTGGHTAPKDYLTEESRLWAWIDRYGKLDAIPTDGRWYAFRNRVDFEHYGTDRAVLIRRGFISEIRCTLAEWCGIPHGCERCGGYRIEEHESAPVDPTGLRLRNCLTCHGTGRTAGIGPQIVRKHPVTRVVLTDCSPEFGNTGTMFRWTDADNTDQAFSFRNSPQNQLPHDVFRLLKGWMLVPNQHPCIRWYASSDVALDALSDALIAWAKVKPVTTTELGCAIPHEEV